MILPMNQLNKLKTQRMTQTIKLISQLITQSNKLMIPMIQPNKWITHDST